MVLHGILTGHIKHASNVNRLSRSGIHVCRIWQDTMYGRQCLWRSSRYGRLCSTFKILVSQDDPANTVELWDNLSMDPSSQDYVETSINDLSDFIEVKDLSAALAPATASLTTANALANPVPFAGGGETLVV